MEQELHRRLKNLRRSIRHNREQVETNVLFESHHCFQKFGVFFGIVTAQQDGHYERRARQREVAVTVIAT